MLRFASFRLGVCIGWTRCHDHQHKQFDDDDKKEGMKRDKTRKRKKKKRPRPVRCTHARRSVRAEPQDTHTHTHTHVATADNTQHNTTQHGQMQCMCVLTSCVNVTFNSRNEWTLAKPHRSDVISCRHHPQQDKSPSKHDMT